MDPVVGEFNFTRLEKVIFGPGKVGGLGRELERRGLKRALIVTGKTLGRSALLDKVTGATGGRMAGVFKGASQHVPSATVAALVEEYQRSGADCMISFGGGSPIDTVKVAAKRILDGSGSKGADAHTIDIEGAMGAGATGSDLIHIALPTTLSAGEYTPVGGVTDEAHHIKGGVADPRLQPRTIFLDPELTMETPAWLWAATGMRAVDHAVEASYSARHQPLTDALAARICDAFGLFGTAEECLERLKRAHTESGIDHVFIFPTHTLDGGYDLPRAELAAFRDVILPRLRED